MAELSRIRRVTSLVRCGQAEKRHGLFKGDVRSFSYAL